VKYNWHPDNHNDVVRILGLGKQHFKVKSNITNCVVEAQHNIPYISAVDKNGKLRPEANTNRSIYEDYHHIMDESLDKLIENLIDYELLFVHEDNTISFKESDDHNAKHINEIEAQKREEIYIPSD
jgi:hypothetical protein